METPKFVPSLICRKPGNFTVYYTLPHKSFIIINVPSLYVCMYYYNGLYILSGNLGGSRRYKSSNKKKITRSERTAG